MKSRFVIWISLALCFFLLADSGKKKNSRKGGQPQVLDFSGSSSSSSSQDTQEILRLLKEQKEYVKRIHSEVQDLKREVKATNAHLKNLQDTVTKNKKLLEKCQRMDHNQQRKVEHIKRKVEENNKEARDVETRVQNNKDTLDNICRILYRIEQKLQTTK